MEKEFRYSFDDEPVRKFCFDIRNQKLEIQFEGFYDLTEHAYKETECSFIIENWAYAKAKVGEDSKLYELNKKIGIFNLILYMKYNENNEFEMLVNTVDNKYLTIFFGSPRLRLSCR